MKSKLPVEACDVSYALSLVGGKWKLVIIWKLRAAPMRLSGLRRALPGISEAVLITQLKELQQDGLVIRTDFQTVPPHVEYSLTSEAHELTPVLFAMEIWGAQQRKKIVAE